MDGWEDQGVSGLIDGECGVVQALLISVCITERRIQSTGLVL